MLVSRIDAPLGQEWFDHALSGNWAGYCECHIGGDFLLIYRVDDRRQHGLVFFVRAGTVPILSFF